MTKSGKRDVVLACVGSTEIIGWGIVEGNYTYRPTRSFGSHYRNVLWHEVRIPFTFTNKRPVLYSVPKQETLCLKETLSNKCFKRGLPLPFGFGEKASVAHVGRSL